MKTLRKLDLDAMGREFMILGNPESFLGGTKGDYQDPYTASQFASMLDSGSWTTGGWVGSEYYGPTPTVIGSSSSIGSGSSTGSHGSYDDNWSTWGAVWQDFFQGATTAAAQDIVSTILPQAGNISTGASFVDDISNGNYGKNGINLLFDAMSGLPGGNTMVQMAKSSANILSEISIRWNNYIMNMQYNLTNPTYFP